MTHTIYPIPFKPPRLIGLSERLLANHYEIHYGGAVRRLNDIEARLDRLDGASLPDVEINGLKREQLAAANAMCLHEVYFDSLGGADGLGSPAVDPTGDLAAAIARDFGSLDRWRGQLVTLGKALANSGGWVILSWSRRQRRLINQQTADHAHGLADSVPILALDMDEHAYCLDFGAFATAYIDAYLNNLHWDRPARRFAAALTPLPTPPAADLSDPADTLAPESLRAWLARGEPPLLLDVCLAEDWAKRYDKLPGAHCVTAEHTAEWIDTLPTGRPIVAYCVYGFQVSGNAVTELRRRGFDARRLAGGIAGWHAIGGPTEPLAP